MRCVHSIEFCLESRLIKGGVGVVWWDEWEFVFGYECYVWKGKLNYCV